MCLHQHLAQRTFWVRMGHLVLSIPKSHHFKQCFVISHSMTWVSIGKKQYIIVHILQYTDNLKCANFVKGCMGSELLEGFILDQL